MGFGLQGRTAASLFFLSRCSGYSRILTRVFAPLPFHLSPCARFVSPRAFAFGGPRSESDIMATGLGDTLPPYP